MTEDITQRKRSLKDLEQPLVKAKKDVDRCNADVDEFRDQLVRQPKQR